MRCIPGPGEKSAGLQKKSSSRKRRYTMFDPKDLWAFIKENIIVIVVILYILFMMHFKIWPVW